MSSMDCPQSRLLIVAMALAALFATGAAQERPPARAQAEGDGGGLARWPAARFRRQTGHAHRLSPGQLTALGSQAEQQALVEADEQTLKRQLPDLIAQAHNDKTLERALLRLVISASLRNSNLMGLQQALSPAPPQQQQQQQQQQQLANGNQWQLDNTDNAQNNLAQYNQANSGSAGEFAPIRLARLEPNELANLESQLAGELPELPASQFGALSSPMDKREYTKPCSFNAISCVRTPFRRLK